MRRNCCRWPGELAAQLKKLANRYKQIVDAIQRNLLRCAGPHHSFFLNDKHHENHDCKNCLVRSCRATLPLYLISIII